MRVPDDRAVWLIRHAMPEVVAETDPRQWQLSAAGSAAAHRLRTILPAIAVPVASDEIKAVQTLQQAYGVTAVHTDADFGEVRRPHEWTDDHQQRARAYLNGAEPTGWEPQHHVAARFNGAVDRHRKPGRPLVVATHGMACTVWIAATVRQAGHPRLDPGEFWSRLHFPDVIIVDPDTGTIRRHHP